MTDEIWSHIHSYKASGEKAKQSFEVPGGTLELVFTMSTVRALFRPPASPYPDESAWREAAEALLREHQLKDDYRDDSYVFSTQEGMYLGRLRPEEFLFTPERFEDKDELLAAIVALYAPSTDGKR